MVNYGLEENIKTKNTNHFSLFHGKMETSPDIILRLNTITNHIGFRNLKRKIQFISC